MGPYRLIQWRCCYQNHQWIQPLDKQTMLVYTATHLLASSTNTFPSWCSCSSWAHSSLLGSKSPDDVAATHTCQTTPVRTEYKHCLQSRTVHAWWLILDAGSAPPDCKEAVCWVLSRTLYLLACMLLHYPVNTTHTVQGSDKLA